MQFVGMGGPAMRAEGLKPVARTEELSVMGFTEVLAKLPTVFDLLRRIKRGLAEERPFALVLIDAPDFNFRVAKMAGPMDMRVFYYSCPQVWAWRQGRVRFLKRHVDRMLLFLPFEKPFYDKWNMPASYIGHPLVEETCRPELAAIRPEPNRIGILPGSRRREIETLMPVFAEAAALLHRLDPSLVFSLMPAPCVDPDELQADWPAQVPLTVHAPAERYAVMRSCRMLMAASGTVTLESALLGVPTVVAYKFSALSFALGKLLVKVPHISLPNLVLGREIFPELLQSEATGRRVAERALDWLKNPEAEARVRADLAALAALLGPAGAAGRAAAIILDGVRRDGQA
jgi:lipid-A-disaccharide synthase